MAICIIGCRPTASRVAMLTVLLSHLFGWKEICYERFADGYPACPFSILSDWGPHVACSTRPVCVTHLSVHVHLSSGKGLTLLSNTRVGKPIGPSNKSHCCSCKDTSLYITVNNNSDNSKLTTGTLEDCRNCMTGYGRTTINFKDICHSVTMLLKLFLYYLSLARRGTSSCK